MLFLFGIFAWGIVYTTLLFRVNGKLKRGFKIKSEPISNQTIYFLKNLNHNIVIRSQLFNSVTDFILVKNNEILIQSRRKYWRTSWIYVGYVDLNQVSPVIEYRVSLPMHLLLIPFILTIIAIPLIIPFMFLNYESTLKTSKIDQNSLRMST